MQVGVGGNPGARVSGGHNRKEAAHRWGVAGAGQAVEEIRLRLLHKSGQSSLQLTCLLLLQQ